MRTRTAITLPLAGALVLLAGGSLLAPALAQTPEEPPNFLIIMVDDAGYGDVTYNGAPDIDTVNIDALKDSGVNFANGFNNSPVCSPSRAGFMTARYASHFGQDWNPVWNPEDPYYGLAHTETTIPDLLTDTYRTGIVGKWHLGAGPGLKPLERGFDYFFGLLSGSASYWENGNCQTDILCIHENETPYDTEGQYLTYVLTDKAVEFVKDLSKEPFFLFLSYNAPHGPAEAPEDLLEKYSHVEPLARRMFVAMFDAVDQGVGDVIAALEEAGKRENTLVFFLSDNGGASNHAEVMARNLPFRENKGSLHEGGIRTPFIGSWPAQWPAGMTYEPQVINLDIGATAVALAGKVPPAERPLHGVNLHPFVMGTATGVPHEALFWRRWCDCDWGPHLAVRTNERKLYRNRRKGVFFYDLTVDPTEQDDLAQVADAGIQDEIHRLAALWNEWEAGNAENRYPHDEYEALWEEHGVDALPVYWESRKDIERFVFEPPVVELPPPPPPPPPAAPPLDAVLSAPSVATFGVAVAFDASESVGAQSYRWDFGDGRVIPHPNTNAAPSHTYFGAGSFEVVLEIARGNCGEEYCETDTASAVVFVPAPPPPVPPTAGFDLTACRQGSAGLCIVETDTAVSFTDRSTGDVERALWDFGDGTTTGSRAPEHTWRTPGFYSVTLTVAGAGETSTVTRVVLVRAKDPAGTCEPDSRTLCLQDSRFAVRIGWTYGEEAGGDGRVVHAGTNDSGLFRFFGGENWELLIKVLDGCSINDSFWVFGAAATDLGYRVSVTDTVTGQERIWENASGQAARAITDTGAFTEVSGALASSMARALLTDGPAGEVPPGADDSAVLAGSAVLPGSAAATDLQPSVHVNGRPLAVETGAGGCGAGAGTLCLLDGRFEVQVRWSAAGGEAGPGRRLPPRTDGSGLFYFFDPANWEMLVKVLDGCAVNGHHWVLAAYATDLGLEVTVRDTMTGASRVYTKEPGASGPALVDVAAFPETCKAP